MHRTVDDLAERIIEEARWYAWNRADPELNNLKKAIDVYDKFTKGEHTSLERVLATQG